MCNHTHNAVILMHKLRQSWQKLSIFSNAALLSLVSFTHQNLNGKPTGWLYFVTHFLQVWLASVSYSSTLLWCKGGDHVNSMPPFSSYLTLYNYPCVCNFASQAIVWLCICIYTCICVGVGVYCVQSSSSPHLLPTSAIIKSGFSCMPHSA